MRAMSLFSQLTMRPVHHPAKLTRINEQDRRAAPPVRTWTGRRRPATLAKCVPSCLPNGRWNPGLPVDGQRPPRYRPGLLQQPSSTNLSSRETRQTLRKYMRFGVSGQLLNPVWPLNWQVEDARRKKPLPGREHSVKSHGSRKVLHPFCRSGSAVSGQGPGGSL